MNWSKKSGSTETSMTVKFDLGHVVATPGALEALEAAGQEPGFFLDKHASGNWGDVDADDALLNDEALKDGGRVLSAFKTLRGVKLWVLTEAVDDDGNRAATTILLPSEY
jgi:hypothetical protein